MLWPQVPLWAVSTEAQTGPFGSQLHSDEYVENETPLINPSNILGGKIVPNQAVTVDEPTARRLSRHRLIPGDLLFARRGELGRAAVVTQEAAGWLCGTGSLRVRLRPGTLDAGFAAYVLQSAATRSYFELVAVGTTMDNLNTAIVMGLPVPLPPKQDQLRIADFLDTETGRVDAIISKKHRLLELADLKRRAIAAQRYDQAAHEYGLLPIRHLLHGIEQGWSPECENREADPSEWGVLKAGCVNHDVFHPEQNKALPAYTNPRLQYVVMEGDLLMCRASGSRELIGNAAIVGKLDRRLLLCDKIYRIHVNNRFAIPEFLASMIGAPQLRDLIGLGISGATGLANNIPTEVVRNLPVPRLPIREQSQMATILEKGSRSTRRVTEAIERQIGLLQERRQALITAAVTGELEIPD